ncbi:MAG: hypothetical protein RUDDFDWM_001380 [Candidatus Fervidibacterota bacterium]
MQKVIEIHDIGVSVPYLLCLELQERLRNLRSLNLIANKLLLLEHEPTITLGRSSSNDDLLLHNPSEKALSSRSLISIPIVQCNRGGSAMLHLPGQVVAYAIVHLKDIGFDVMQFLYALEVSMIKALSMWRINAARLENHRGAWVFIDGWWHKIGFVGLAIRRWVSMHGIAVNVSVDLSMFRLLRTCKLPPDVICDMASVLGRTINIGEFKKALAECVASALGMTPRFVNGGLNVLLEEVEAVEVGLSSG